MAFSRKDGALKISAQYQIAFSITSSIEYIIFTGTAKVPGPLPLPCRIVLYYHNIGFAPTAEVVTFGPKK